MLLLLLTTLLVLSSGCRRRCLAYTDYAGLEVGIGSRGFIETPPGTQVQPQSDEEGRHFQVALRGYGLAGRGLTVDLSAWIDDLRVAASRYENVRMKCRAYETLETSNLRLALDPSVLPPVPVSATPTEIEGEIRDTGLWWDTGISAYTVRAEADLRVEARVTEPSGRQTVAETYWFVYR